jgi:hypothetical protein
LKAVQFNMGGGLAAASNLKSLPSHRQTYFSESRTTHFSPPMSIRALTSTNGFTINVYRVDASVGWLQQLRVNWQAWQ